MTVGTLSSIVNVIASLDVRVAPVAVGVKIIVSSASLTPSVVALRIIVAVV